MEIHLYNVEINKTRYVRGLFVGNEATKKIYLNTPKSYRLIGYGRIKMDYNTYQIYKNKKGALILHMPFQGEDRKDVYIKGEFKILCKEDLHLTYYQNVYRDAKQYIRAYGLQMLPNNTIKERLQKTQYVTTSIFNNYYVSRINAGQFMLHNWGVVEDAIRHYNVDMGKQYSNWTYLDSLARLHMLDFIDFDKIKQELTLI